MADILSYRPAARFDEGGEAARPAPDPHPRIGVQRVEFVLFAVATLLIVAAGCGITLLALPSDRSTSVLNRSKKDWHRQSLPGTTVFVQKTVPKETVHAFNYRT